MCLSNASNPGPLNGPPLIGKTSIFPVSGWCLFVIRFLANCNFRIVSISLATTCALFTLAGCADFPKQLETFLTADELIKESAKVPPKPKEKSEQEQISELQAEVAILRQEINELRPSVEELMQIDADIRKLLERLSGMGSSDSTDNNKSATTKDSSNGSEQVTSDSAKTDSAADKQSPAQPEDPDPSKPSPNDDQKEPQRTRPLALTKKVEKTLEPNKQIGIHLASFRELTLARKGWKDIMTAHGDVLVGLDYRISKIDLTGDRGTYFRLKAGPFIDKASANESCQLLKARKAYCVLSKFTGIK